MNMYGGSEKKRTMFMDNRWYMVKFPDPVRERRNDLSYMNNSFSEYLGCHILSSMGFDVQKTFLGEFHTKAGKTKIVVACEDFTQDGAILTEFSKLLTNDVENDRHIAKSVIPIESVFRLLDETPETVNHPEFKDKFWDMFVADTLIGNQDRHLDNWGFLTDKSGIRFAPIYDCGSSLSPLLSDERIKDALADKDIFAALEYNLSSPYSLDGKRIFYPSIYQTPPMELERALERVVPKIDRNVILALIDQTEGMSDIRKQYVAKAVMYRSEQLLERALKRKRKREEKARRHERQKNNGWSR